MPSIAETILERIDGCGLFLADLTFVGAAETRAEETPPKLIPNALLELGYPESSWK